MKKAQNGEETTPTPLRKGQINRIGRIAKTNDDRAKQVFGRMKKRAGDPLFKDGWDGGKKKAEKGGAFGMLSVKAGIDKNPKPTQADRIAGAKGMAKSGKKVAKKMMKSGGTVSMQLGSYKDIIGKNYKGKNTKAVGLTKAMNGKKMKGGGKCKNGC
jgi:hypothetical protein